MPMHDNPWPPGNQWQITITVEIALCIGDSGGRDALLDKTTVKDRDGNLYIPASTLKGIWRHACEAIARGLGKYVCESPRAENMCPKPNTSDNYCIVCEIFGMIGGRAFCSVIGAPLQHWVLFFQDAFLIAIFIKSSGEPFFR